MAFVLLIEPMVSSKQKMQIRNKLLFTHWLRFKTTLSPNGDRSELSLIRCKTHEPVSKNKVGSASVVTSFVPGA